MLKQMADNLEQPTEIQDQDEIDQKRNADEEGLEIKQEIGIEEPSAIAKGVNGLGTSTSLQEADPAETNEEQA